MNKTKPKGMRIGESAFCIFYLCYVAYCAFRFLNQNDTVSGIYLLMALFLGIGDSFHLIPRIIINIKGETDDENINAKRRFFLGLGNLISSITMTLFYVFLFEATNMAHPGHLDQTAVSFIRYSLIVLSIIRIILCLNKNNGWFDKGDQRWSVIRNIPFLLIGFTTIIYLVFIYRQHLLALIVFLSFLCYMTVVLYARRKPMLGMMMIPKTICYMAMLGLFLK